MRTRFLAGLLALATAMAASAWAEGKYDQGASDTEIKIGQTIGYSAQGGVLGIFGYVQVGFINRLNEAGGINGRKVTLLSYDDNYTPSKTVEMVRQLVEQDGVLAISGSGGAATNLAVRDYLASKGVPQLFINSSVADPKNYPTQTTAAHSNVAEGWVMGAYIVKNIHNPKVAVLYPNDEYGKDQLKGLKEALKDESVEILTIGFDRTAPTVDSEVTQLASSGANAFVVIGIGKHAAQAIRRAGQLGWKAQLVLNFAAGTAVLDMPKEELSFAKGAVSPTWYKNPGSPSYANDPGIKEYKEFLAKWAPQVPANSSYGINAYISISMLEYVLRQAGDDLTRENLVRLATNIKDLSLPILPEGVTINVTPDNYFPFRSGRIQRFDGKDWILEDGVFTF